MTRPPTRDSLAIEAGNSAVSLPERAWADRIRAADASAIGSQAAG